MRCADCSESASRGRNFCTSCGSDLRPDRVIVTAGRPRVVAQPRIVACPACGAVNAASRSACGRCHAPLDGDPELLEMVSDDEQDDEVDAPPHAPAPAPAPAPAHAPAPAPAHAPAPALSPAASPEPPTRQSPGPSLVIASVVAGLVILAVLATILNARGVGIFGRLGPDEPADALPSVEIVEARASSVLTPAGAVDYGPAKLVDGDPATAWQEGASGDGAGEWVQLEFAREATVRRLLIWNGYQKGVLFADHNRAAMLRIDIGDRTFTVELLDIEGPQAVDLPEAVTADRIRLEILQVYEGLRYNDTALSQIEVYAEPAAAMTN